MTEVSFFSPSVVATHTVPPRPSANCVRAAMKSCRQHRFLHSGIASRLDSAPRLSCVTRHERALPRPLERRREQPANDGTLCPITMFGSTTVVPAKRFDPRLVVWHEGVGTSQPRRTPTEAA